MSRRRIEVEARASRDGEAAAGMRLCRRWRGIWRSGRDARQIDGEDAPHTWKRARIDAAVDCLHRPPAERQSETRPRPIGAALLEWLEQVCRIPGRQTATFVLHLDQHTFNAAADPQ